MTKAALHGFEPSTRSEPCDLCGGREFQMVGRLDRRGQALASVLCARCGLISHEALPSDAELQAYYGLQYRSDYHGEYATSPHRVLRAWRSGQAVLRRVRPFLKPGDRVLEIGAGIGCTVKAFESAGYRSEGIEPHQGFQAFAQNRLQARVRRLSLGELPLDEKYDLILLVHVIEHFNRPRRELLRIARLLAPGGRLYVECPNAEAPHAAPGKMFHYAHVYNFTNPTLEMLYGECGLRLQAPLFSPRSRVVGHIAERAPTARMIFDPASYGRTVAGLQRYGALRYHLRPEYAAGRALRAIGHLADRFYAKSRAEALVRRCAAVSDLAAIRSDAAPPVVATS